MASSEKPPSFCPLPGKPEAYHTGLLCRNSGLLYAIVAYNLGLIAFQEGLSARAGTLKSALGDFQPRGGGTRTFQFRYGSFDTWGSYLRRPYNKRTTILGLYQGP